jgi:hypothetical protein
VEAIEQTTESRPRRGRGPGGFNDSRRKRYAAALADRITAMLAEWEAADAKEQGPPASRPCRGVYHFSVAPSKSHAGKTTRQCQRATIRPNSRVYLDSARGYKGKRIPAKPLLATLRMLRLIR